LFIFLKLIIFLKMFIFSKSIYLFLKNFFLKIVFLKSKNNIYFLKREKIIKNSILGAQRASESAETVTSRWPVKINGLILDFKLSIIN
jgi:hypothetical protein